MKSKKFLLATHFYFTDVGPVYGPPNVIFDYLSAKSYPVLLLNYPLISGHRAFLDIFNGKDRTRKFFGLHFKSPLLIKSFFEIITNIVFGIFYRPTVYIGIDPLNALAGVWLRKLGFVGKTVFYCVDYTPTRFKNKLLNSVYLAIDKYCAKNSDHVWNVSTRIVDLRRKQGISDKKIKFVPNSPSFKDCPRLSLKEIDRYKIVMVSGLTHSNVFDIVLKSFKDIHSKFAKTTLNIIGTGAYQDKLIETARKMGLSSSVKFLGQLSNIDLLNEVSKSGLALAIYSLSKDFSWVYYGDSKKAREYLACGVPVVITDVVSTSEDVEKCRAGIVVKLGVNNLSDAIEKIISNKNTWKTYRQNAVSLARKYDIEKILSENLRELI